MFHALSRPSRRRVIAALTALTFALATTAMPALARKKPAKNPPPATMLPINVAGITTNELGQLVAVGTIGDEPFSAVITRLTAEQNPDDADCPILNLELGPIHLDLLGLVVDTSQICLRITAQEGEGLLLGNLLCGVLGILDPVGEIDLLPLLGGLTDAQLNDLLGVITAVLNNILNGQTVTGVSSSQAAAARHQPGHGNAPADCDILNLVLGPVDLNLLGLDVELDDCEGGPVTLDITAVPGEGNLLGNLLCALAGLLDKNNPNTNQIARLLNQIADAIEALL